MFHKKIDQHIDQALKDLEIESPIGLQKKMISLIGMYMILMIISLPWPKNLAQLPKIFLPVGTKKLKS